MVDVAQTLERNELLLTGGNGFLGKVVLALLLDRYPSFTHLHMLIRPGRVATAGQRFEREVIESPPLRAIVQKRGEAFVREKISVWSGDASRPGCGVEVDGWADRVDLILNCAGLVDFFPPVDASLRANVDSVVHLSDLAGRVGAKLLHVSTCYVAGQEDGFVEESEPIAGFYPHRTGADDTSFGADTELRECRRRIQQIREAYEPTGGTSVDASGHDGAAASRELSERLTELGRRRAERWGWVNTYTYSKSIGEQMLASRSELDYAIVRPAIIESSLRFPFAGWIEGGRTSAPLLLMAMGGMSDWPARRDIPLEIVPVDLAAAAILVVGALLLQGRHEPIYQLATADANLFELEPLIELLCREARRPGSNSTRPARVPFWLQTGSRPRFLTEEDYRTARLQLRKRVDRAQGVVTSLRQFVARTRLPGREALQEWSASLRTLDLQISFREQAIEQYLPFILRNRYVFEAHNIRQAYKQITETDRKLLPWEPEQIDWPEYWSRNQIEGIGKWIQPEAVRTWSFKI